jgi:hypothetical protein
MRTGQQQAEVHPNPALFPESISTQDQPRAPIPSGVSELSTARHFYGSLGPTVEMASWLSYRISAARREVLNPLVDYVKRRCAGGECAQLTYICTHNSRRSHFGQVWAAVAGAYFDIPVSTYSGGSEVTSCNARTVAALRRAGFVVETTGADECGEGNPCYRVWYSPAHPAVECYSKCYDADENPRAGFAAVFMCCEADRACPTVHGASARIATPYLDPKVADDSVLEPGAYDERLIQVAAETFYVFARACNG